MCCGAAPRQACCCCCCCCSAAACHGEAFELASLGLELFELQGRPFCAGVCVSVCGCVVGKQAQVLQRTRLLCTACMKLAVPMPCRLFVGIHCTCIFELSAAPWICRHRKDRNTCVVVMMAAAALKALVVVVLQLSDVFFRSCSGACVL